MAFTSSLGDVVPKLIRLDWEEQFYNESGQTVRDASYTPALMASGACDVYPSYVTQNAWRLKKLDFVTLFRSRMMVVVQKSHRASYKSPADLAGSIAAVTKDTSYHTWLQAQNQSAYVDEPVQFHFVEDADASLTAIERGDGNFALVDANLALWAIRHQFKKATMTFAVGDIDQIGWAFRKGDEDLQRAVQAFFAEQKAAPDSKLNQIWKKAFGITLPEFEEIIDTSSP